MNWYKKAQKNLERDLSNPSNVILYHATRKPGLIKQKGIIPSHAGVITKENAFLVYTATTPILAKMALQYEEELKERMGQKIRKIGDIFIIKISVPYKDVTIKPNGDVVLNRVVLPSEIKEEIKS